MPRTRAQANAQEAKSPLVMLENAPRRRRKTTVESPTKPSADTKKATEPKTKRGRKPTQKAEVLATETTAEENTRNKSEIETQEPKPIHSPTQNLQEPIRTPDITAQIQQEPHIVQPPQETSTAQGTQAAKDNVSTPTPTFTTPYPGFDTSSLATLGSTPSFSSAAKKRSVKRAFLAVKEKLKKSAQALKDRFENAKDIIEQHGSPSQVPTTSHDDVDTTYYLSDDKIIEASLEVLLHRLQTDRIELNRFLQRSLRCPCCRGALKLECPKGHDVESWIPDEAKEELNTLLISLCSEALVAAQEARSERLRAEKEAEGKAAQEAESQLKTSPKEQNTGLSAKQKGKKRARDINDVSNNAPKRRRRPMASSVAQKKARAGRTLRNRRTFGRNLSYAETVRQRAMERKRARAQPSMFQLDEAQLQEQAKAAQAAEEAAGEEARNAATRAAMQQHMVSGSIPENMQDSFYIPALEDEEESEEEDEADEQNEENEETDVTEPIQTPSSNTWGIRTFFSSVTGSVRRRLPFVGRAPDQAVPFAAGGGGETPVQAEGATDGPTNREAGPSAQINDTQNSQEIELTYSLFPPSPVLPTIATSASSSEERANVDEERGKTATTDQETVQAPETETNTNVLNGEPENTDDQAEPSAGRNKRKRSPSPDVIPNPPGCSYGMDLDYFTYSDEEIAEQEEYERREREREAAAANSQASESTTQPPEKRARLSSNVRSTNTSTAPPAGTNWPPIPPGWERPTTTVYTGEMFRGMRHHQAPAFPSYPSQESQIALSPVDPGHMQLIPKTPPSPQAFDLRRMAFEQHFRARALGENNYVNNSSGKHPSVQAPAQQPVSPPAQAISQPTREEPTLNLAQQPATPAQSNSVTSQQSHDRHNSIAARTNVSEETIHLPPIRPMSAAAREQPVTERSKPKNPSRLRNRVRLSSSPIQRSPIRQPATHQQNQEDLMQIFGNDEFGLQSYEVFQSCPSGDLTQVQWPEFDPFVVDIPKQAIDITTMSEEQRRINRELFQMGAQELDDEIDQGLVDPQDILNELPL
ncbi:hypothetical protein TSTA_027650 [Talaromyces stipitatus ATCC 10500]|uniref:Uncharacterized protein n=1 Tax=Talaromyces stipitatus (strain ATCC 10500 / CBS 375.48 / QM 6759 / NRRL 1006) TaxID=441959 RepID=B8M6K9_TALSN|nr:uncharacterized protein TSTA_027650 [Talaromyces stipitatus ATCC 10500]EED19471.1 hypothetical protein TSTA_027650 [Talaromyces stipitatus ATCC 10500]